MPTTILRPIFLTLRNRLRRETAGAQNRRRELLLYGFALGTMLCIYTCCALIFPRVASDPFYFALVPQKLIEITFFSFFLLLLLSNSVAAIGNLYTATSTTLLLMAPVSSGRLFFAKLIETVLETSIMYFIFLVPVGVAYCQFFHLPLKFLVEGCIVSLPFLFIPAALGFIIAIAVVRVIALFRKKALLLSLIVTAIFLFLLYRIAMLATEAAAGGEATAALAKMIGLFSNPNPYWYPPRWIADLLGRYLGEVGPQPVLSFLLLVTTAIGTMGLAFLTFDLFFLSTWSNADLQEKEFSGRTAGIPSVRFVERLRPLISNPQLSAIIVKDGVNANRDRSQAIQMLMYLVIAGFHVTSFRVMGSVWNFGGDTGHVWSATMLSMNFLFGGFIVTSLMARLVYPAISLEGKSFWILVVAPLDMNQLIRVKFFSWLPLSVLSTLIFTLAGAIALGANLGQLFCTAYGAVALAIGCTGLAIGLGAIFASFEWEAPNQISSGLGSMVLLLAGLVTVTLTAVLTAALFFFSDHRFRVYMGPSRSMALLIAAPLALILLNALIARSACNLGIKALKLRSQ